jgi:sarcosine oxidase
MGTAAAWRLSRAGRDVVLFEQFPVGHGRGSSHGPTRIFRFAYDDPYYVGMAQRALTLWRELEAESATSLLRTTGGIDVGPEEHLDGLVTALSACGAAAERLSGRALARRFPGLALGGAPAVFSPDTGVLAASDAVHAMADAVGPALRASTPVERIRRGEDRVRLETQSGTLEARRCVVAAGPWSGPLLEPAGVRLPLRVTREQVFYFAGGDDLPVLIHRDGVFRYLVPPFGGAPGTKVGEHGTGPVTRADERTDRIDPAGEARVCEYVAAAAPALRPEPVAAETCLYTMTPDEHFLIDRTGPLIFASPCSGHGFKFAPLIGEILACLATDRRPPVDVTRFGLARFG